MSSPMQHSEPEHTPSLADRVRQRVASADARLRRHGAVASEDAALRRVYRDMGLAQRAMRRRTGRAPVPAVRTAAVAFAAAPSMAALVGVAASLEEVNLLAW